MYTKFGNSFGRFDVKGYTKLITVCSLIFIVILAYYICYIGLLF